MSSSTLATALRQAYRTGYLSQCLLLVACVAGIVGLLSARALVALSPLVGLLSAATNPAWRIELARWWHNPAVVFAALLYAVLVFSGLYTTEWGIWRHELFRQLPLLGVPLTFAVAVPLSGRQRFLLGCMFVLGTALLGTDTLVRYLLTASEVHEMFNTGQNIQTVTGVFHIHFSVMLALAFYFGVLLQRSAYATRLWRWLLLLAVLLIVVVLHVLAYRTGLLVFYSTLLFDAVVLIVARRQFLWGLGALIMFAVLPWLAYKTLEPIQARVNGTYYDLEQFSLNHDINNFSLSKRLAAWQTAQAVVAQHPWFGVGLADTEPAMMEEYRWRDFGLQPVNWVMVHNQYLHYLLGAGIVGLFVWLLVLLGPLAQPRVRRNPYVIHFLLILCVAMLVDSLLQLQIGFNLFVFLYGFLVVNAERQAQQKAG
ncbi:O-antigen ligase family protein [Hymenobacter sp. GOD-10R]|uniref:O-antigen ligase family protein n=1 Tax=Hymenobacter sp. GOD-10R TaxID=3093922 RepID=UPI002D778004|nr:O-antigen ligase family protein [Hymenobacter sp. GOD-10R]WRQ29388.1 O-antigen ligase family protein [Hymenobacter sp. GOD-10R]